MPSIDTVKCVRLASVHYVHPDLAAATKFALDFGFEIVEESDGRVYFGGFGVEPYIYVAEKSPNNQRKFVGATWTVESMNDLKTAEAYPNATPIADRKGPGGGKSVTVTDPNGFLVSFIYGQKEKSAKVDAGITLSKSNQAPPNKAVAKTRYGAFQRFQPGPSPIHKVGHYGYIVPASKYDKTFEWYTTMLNLKPMDAVYSPETGKDTTCFMHIDRKQEYSDHHSFFLGAGPEAVPPHVHHSSFEVNDFDTQCLGHDFLLSRGWTNCWGVGRHVLGSQIFDYWFDASGNILEHYSDGDLVNQETPTTREMEAPDSLYIWGPNIPLAFVTGRIEDAGKPFPNAPPTPAQLVGAGR